MSFIDKAMDAATMAVPGRGPEDSMQQAFDAMPMQELAATWCAVQSVPTARHTDGSWAATLYFDRLPHAAPERAFALVLEVLRTTTDRSLRLQLGRDVMATLVHRHGAALLPRIEHAAADNDGLRWLLGGTYWWTDDETLKQRLKALADIAGWRADDEAHSEPALPLDYGCMSLGELARAWVEQKSKPSKDYDANWHALCDYERDLIADDPDRMLDLILEILQRADAEHLLGLLAAGPLEDVVSMAVIDRVEQEAAANERFRDLLRGVWYWNEPDDLKVRLDAILKTDA